MVERLEGRRLLAATYYVSPAGLDTHAGTSPDQAWASVAKVDATVFQPGDTILFQRGGEWHGQLEGSASGTAASPITYGDYGDAALARPTFSGSDYVPTSAYAALGNSVYTFPTSVTPNGQAYWVYVNHAPLQAATSGGAGMPANSFFVSGSTVYINTNGVNPATATVSVGDRATGQGADQGVIASNGYSYLTFNNLIGRETAQVPGGGSLAGGIPDAYVVRVQGGTNVTLNNVDALYGGKHNVGAIDPTNFLANGVTANGGVNGVSGNTLPYGNATALVAYADGNVHHTTQSWVNCVVKNYFGDQPAFLTHNDGTDSIDSLLIQNLSSYGSPVALQPGTNVAITYRGGFIANNTLTAYGAAGTTEFIDGLHVYSDNGGTGQKIEMYADNSTIQNCLVTGSGQVGGIQSYGSNATIRFNTVSMQGYASAAIQLGSGASGTKLYGNITTGTGNALLVNGSPTYTADYDVFDTNAGGPTFKVGGNSYTGLAAFRTATGQETHGAYVDPKFVGVASGDYSLQSGSPAINFVPTGSISGVATDIRGFARPSANVYDAGAYEYQSVLHPPTIATAAAASPSPVNGTTTNLSALGASADGEGTLTYTWTTTGTPPAAVTYSVNGTNAAKNTVATFTKAGTYTFLVTIGNGQYSTTSIVAVVVNAVAMTVTLTPPGGFIPVSTTQQFAAVLKDQFGNAITGQSFAYAVTGGGGTISSSGLYTAPATAGSATITATAAGITGAATLTITPPNQAPTIATAASATPNPVTSTSTALSVLGADDNGEANLTYTWTLAGTPPAPVSYSVNGTNAAKNTVATFTANGRYNFVVTVTDSGGLSTTSTVSVTVNTIVPVVVDGTRDGVYGSPIVVQTQPTNYGNGNLGAPTAPYSQLSAAYAVIDPANGVLDVFLAGSLNLNNAHLDLLIDSVPDAGVADLSSLYNVGPYGTGGFSTVKFDTGFRPDHIFTSTYGGGTSIDYVNLDTGTRASSYISDPASGLITSNNGLPYFQERVNNAAQSGVVAANTGGGVATGAEFAFRLSDLGYTAANFAAGVPINLQAMITYGSHTESTDQILAPYTPSASELARDGGVYTYFGNGNFDFSNNTRFAGNQFFTIAPPAVAAPDVESFTVNDGSAQRSMVRTFTLKFTGPVTLDAGAITLTRTSDSTPTAVTFTATTSDGGTTYVLTPTSGTTYGSLTDGTYALVVHPSGVHSAANASTTMTGSDRTYSFYRLFADIDGNAVVNFTDFLGFQAAFGSTSGSPGFVSGFDYDNSGVVDFTDFLSLQSRFGATAQLTRAAVTPAVGVSPTLTAGVAGTNFSYFEGAWSKLPDFNSLTPVKSGLTHNFDTSIRQRDTNYAFVWTGQIAIAKAGAYTFYTGSDDASALLIDGHRVVSNDGLHAYAEKSGTVTLTAGTHTIQVQYLQAGRGQRLTVNYQGPGLTKRSVPDSVLTGTSPGSIFVRNYGAVGDGVADDSAAIQRAIDAAPDGATLVLDAGKTYKLNTGLTMARPLNVSGNGATLRLNTSAYPQNETVYYASPLAPAASTWKQTARAGQTTFNVKISTDVLVPGDTVFLQLGTDPHDATQPNWAEVCQVVANTGSSITVNIPVPYNITQGTRPNSIRRLTDVAQNVSFRNVNFSSVAGTTPDANLWLERARNVTVSGLGGDFTIMANVTNSQNVTVTGNRGTLHQLTSSGGRFVSAWQTDGLKITDNTVTTAADAPAVFLESWARNTTISGLTVNWQNPNVSSHDVFHFTGDSYNTTADAITINNAGAVNLVDSGGEPSKYAFGTVTINGPIKSAPLSAITQLVTPGHTYDATTLTTRTFTVPVAANLSDYQVPLASGVVRSMAFTPTSLAGVSGLFVTNSDGAGYQLAGSLTTGKTTTLPQLFGTDYAFNRPTAPDKRLHLYTGPDVAPGTTLAVSVTYYA